MTNQQFKKIYKDYSEHHVHSSGKPKNIVSYYNDSRMILLLSMNYLFVVFILILGIQSTLEYFFNTFGNSGDVSAIEFKNRLTFVYMVLVVGSFYITAKLNRNIVFFFASFLSENLKKEMKMRKFIYTGDLDSIFDNRLFHVNAALKNKKELLMTDLENLKGIKGDTILKIFHDSISEKVKYLTNEKDIELEKLGISGSIIKMVEDLYSLTIEQEIEKTEDKISFHQRYINTVTEHIEQFEKKDPEYKNTISGTNELKDYEKRLEKSQQQMAHEKEKMNNLLKYQENKIQNEHNIIN